MGTLPVSRVPSSQPADDRCNPPSASVACLLPDGAEGGPLNCEAPEMPTPPTILFLDAATTTGWACGPVGSVPESGSFRWIEKSSSHGALGWAVIGKVRQFINERKPDEILYESPISPHFLKGRTNFETTVALVGITFAIETAAYGFGFRSRNVTKLTVSQIRHHFIGANPKGDEGKERVWRKCVGLGWIDPETDEDTGFDRTDALAGWSLAETLIAPKLATPVDDLIVAAEAKKRGKVFRP